MTIRAISISQLVLNEIAWSPGDPGTGAPSFSGARMPRRLIPCKTPPLRFRFILRKCKRGQERTMTKAPAKKAQKGVGMEGFIATWYARQTGHDLDEFKATARRIAPHIGAGVRVLEIAPGPGYLAIELVKLTGCRMVGLDLSHTFVRIAGANAHKAGLRIDFEQGDAADLPFAAEQFDFIVCRAAFKNFARPLEALDEMRRVLRANGVALIIDLRKDFSPQAVNDYVRCRGFINAAIIKLTFNTMLKKRAYGKERIAELVARSQFRQGDVRLDPIGFELWLRK
jgi:ubiquinone/menaquinone biosynthesis C-methylase UbiE